MTKSVALPESTVATLVEVLSAALEGKRDCKPLTLRELEQAHIERVLAMVDGNKTKAAFILGISLNTLYNRLNHYEAQKCRK